MTVKLLRASSSRTEEFHLWVAERHIHDSCQTVRPRCDQRDSDGKVLPGLLLVSMAGTGWNCRDNISNRRDVLSAGACQPAILVKAAALSGSVTDQVRVAGGGATAIAASDANMITASWY
jgi:hypothetical protein